METKRKRSHSRTWPLAIATLAAPLGSILSGADLALTLQSTAAGRIDIMGPPGQVYWLETTPDLETWSPLVRRTLTNGMDHHEDSAMVVDGFRFYRALPQTLVIVASNLWSPTKLILAPGGSAIVAEAGQSVNTGRITVITPSGEVRSILSGLPSGRMPPENAPSGPAGLVLLSKTLYIAIGSGDSTLNGSSPGRESVNPSPSSPIFSSILQCEFDREIEDLMGTFNLAEDHASQLAQGNAVSLTNSSESVAIRLLVDFPDAVADPDVGARPANLFGMDTDGANLYVANAGMNQLLKVNLTDGGQSVLAAFPRRSNPTAVGPRLIDPVPDDVHCWNGAILVSCLTGFPFLARFGDVIEVDAVTGDAAPFLTGLTLPIGVAAFGEAADAPWFALEYSAGSFGTAGQLLRFAQAGDEPLTLTGSIGSPTGLAVDSARRMVWIVDNSGGRVLRLQTW